MHIRKQKARADHTASFFSTWHSYYGVSRADRPASFTLSQSTVGAQEGTAVEH
jgi:hypothetical protein